ncbi:MAG: hypothetical protein JSU65_01605 [Candidatus Zixiibacteriota bacterium]|nr:MAG: hypothetical protein JSU65_01605 [candidate division Zixibacteria bacterium]
MHPTRKELIKFVNDEVIDSQQRGKVADHVAVCEFCSEFCNDYRQLSQPLELSPSEPFPERLQQLADRVYDCAIRSRVIELGPLTAGAAEEPASYLAADGTSDEVAGVRSLATLCSENPEVVLRVIHDPSEAGSYLQLMASDPRLAAHVMVQVPELGREFVTDAAGRAAVDLEQVEHLERLKWQIKLAEAVFTLEPLKYDPDKTEYAEQITLETERHDRIEVRFEGKTEGKLLSIKVIELDGRSDFGPVKLAVSQKGRADLVAVEPGQDSRFDVSDAEATINIRVYQ